jgi:hypothetical protein
MSVTVTHLSYEGRVQEIPPEAFVVWLTGTIVSPFDLVRMLHWAEYFGMSGKSVGESLQIINMAIQRLRENIAVIDDARVLHAINLVLPSLEMFATAISEIRKWQDTHVSKKTRTAHNKATRLEGPHVPPWHKDEEFRIMLQKSTEAFSRYLVALNETIQIIREVFPDDALLSCSEQLDRALKQVPDIQMALEVGYEEAVRRKAIESGYLPSA